jgi:predicted PurR-regulated permease PerM
MRDQNHNHNHFQIRSGWLRAMQVLITLVLTIGVFYWARDILIPIALAVLLTFILAPIVTGLRRKGLGRTTSVLVTVILTFVFLAGIGTVIFVEFRSLANELPNYRQNIRKKVADLRLVTKGGSLEKVQNTVNEVLEDFKRGDPKATNAPPAVPVVVTEQRTVQTPGLSFLGPLMEPLASAGLVIVLVIFMLLRREDLRDRLLRLAGYGRLAATTKAIDEAGKLVSRYLLRQCLLNAIFGTGLGIGLFFIGLPYAMLWGFLAFAARFIPYVGPLLGGVSPALLSLAVFHTWTPPLLVIALVVGWELINNMILEPVIYGQSVGVSEVALLVMIAFWTWLWGPIGLLLATPLTVCLMVIGKSVPDLEFISLLLSRETALDAHHVFYQRLVAKDRDEAQEIVELFAKEHSRAELFDQLLIPTLISCRHDYGADRITDQDQEFVYQVIRQLLALDDNDSIIVTGSTVEKLKPQRLGKSQAVDRPLILGWPGNDEADELALSMLAELLRDEDWPVQVLSAHILNSESLAEVEKAQPALVCIGFLPEGPLFPVRQLCKRLRSRFPKMTLVIGRWGAKEHSKIQHSLSDLVEAIGWNLAESKNQIVQLAQINPPLERPGRTAVPSPENHPSPPSPEDLTVSK